MIEESLHMPLAFLLMFVSALLLYHYSNEQIKEQHKRARAGAFIMLLSAEISLFPWEKPDDVLRLLAIAAVNYFLGTDHLSPPSIPGAVRDLIARTRGPDDPPAGIAGGAPDPAASPATQPLAQPKEQDREEKVAAVHHRLPVVEIMQRAVWPDLRK